MRATSAILGVLIALAGTAVHAQSSAPADAPAAATPAPSTVSVPANEAPAGAAAATPAPAATATPAPNTPAAEAAANDRARQAEWARIAQQRAEVQLMLARARAASSKAGTDQPATEREPEHVRHGDAGAAFALGLSFDAPWYTDPGYDVFADNDSAARFGLWVGYDVAALREDAFLALELGWGTESEDDDVLGVVDTKLSTQLAYLGATVRWVPLAWLQPHLRLAGGMAFVDAELTAGGTHFRDGAGGFFKDLLSPYGSAGLGFTVRTNTRAFEDHRGKLASLSLGLMFEGGYTLAKPVDIALDGPGPSARDITLSEPQLGELERSGPYFRVSLVGRI